jgi:phosphomannomutase
VVNSGGGSVVIGYDARHNSEVFARDSAEVFAGAGMQAMVLPEPLPTPVLAFAIEFLGCAAGIMVTASHNPAADNGYKVYLGDGSQIVPPTDVEISGLIEHVAQRPLADIPRSDDWITLDDAALQAYIAATATLIPAEAPKDITVVHTALHGVGTKTLRQVFAAAHFPEPISVEEQQEPDPDFPTVAFPNPEEPGAIDLALHAAQQVNADLVIANDPDADRCAVAVPESANWRMLHGDDVGYLLAWWIAEHPLTRSVPNGVMAQSLVSGSMLQPIADEYGFRYERTLTGFKWIGRIPELVYGYEEALGYCVDPRTVHDKDGISAALVLTHMAAALKAQGSSLLDAYANLERRFGVHASAQVSVRVADTGRIRAALHALRSEPPTQIGGLSVIEVIDLERGAWGLPPTEGLYFALTDGARVIIRPSGTEPKVKAYLQAVCPVVDDDLVDARASANHTLETLATDVRNLLP